MILLIDNYDSFTYNLYQYIGELYRDIQVVRNDEITIEQIEALPCVASGHSAQDRMGAGAACRAGGYRIAV